MPKPAGSYLTMPVSGGRRFSYHKLTKLPDDATLHQQELSQEQPQATAAAATSRSIQGYYHSYYRALLRRHRRQGTTTTESGAAAWRWRRRGTRRPRLRISGLARALRGAGRRVRASVARVARRLRDGRPYVADLFSGNYMFMQVAPSPTATAAGLAAHGCKGYPSFADYYYGSKVPAAKSTGRPALQAHPAAAGGIMYKV